MPSAPKGRPPFQVLEDQILNAEQLRCLVSSNGEAMVMFGEQSPEAAELFSRCGVPPGLVGERPAPPRITSEVEACLVDAAGEEAMRDIFFGAAGC